MLVPRRVYRSYRYIHHIQWWEINIDNAWKSHYSTYQVEEGPNPLFFQGCILPETNSLHLKIAGWKRTFFWDFSGAKMIQKNLSESMSHNSRQHTGVSKNSGTPKSSILTGFSIKNHPFWGTSIFGNTHTPLKHPTVTSYSWASLGQKLISLPGATSQNISNSTEEAGSSTSCVDSQNFPPNKNHLYKLSWSWQRKTVFVYMCSPRKKCRISNLGTFILSLNLQWSNLSRRKNLGLTFNASLEGNLHKVQKAMEVEWLPRKPWTLVSGQEPAVAK